MTWLVLFVLLAAMSLLLVVARRNAVLTPTALALFLQICLSLGLYAKFGLVGDAELYQKAGSALAEAWKEGTALDVTITEGKHSIAWIVGAAYWLAVPSPVIPLLALAVVTATLPVLLTLATKIFGFPSASRVAAWLAAIIPQILFWSPWMRREPLAFVILALAVVSMALIFSGRFPSGLTLSVATYWLGIQTRPALNLVLIAGVIAAVLSNFCLTRCPPTASKRRTHGAWALGVGVVGTIGAAVTVSNTYLSESLDTERRSAIMEANGSSEHTLSVTSLPSTSVGWDGLRLLGRTFDVLFGPFAWSWESIEWIVAGLDGLMLLAVVSAIVWLGVLDKASRPLILILFTAVTPLIIGEVIMHANFGITMRVRAHIIVVLLPVLAVALHRLQISYQQRHQIVGAPLKDPKLRRRYRLRNSTTGLRSYGRISTSSITSESDKRME